MRYIKLHNSRLYGRWYKIVIESGRLNFDALALLDAENWKPRRPGRQTNFV